MPFIRVRGAIPGDPLHEFDVTSAEVAKHPELYDVIDAKPAPTARPVSYVDGVVKNKPTKKPAKRTGENSKPRTGHDSKE